MIVYATYQLPSGEWQEISAWNEPDEVIKTMAFHAQGRPWVVTSDQDTLEKFIAILNPSPEEREHHARKIRPHPCT